MRKLSFLTKKQVFLELTIFFILTTGNTYTKLLLFSERLVKIKIKPPNKDFSLEMRLCNIFETANSMTLTETTLESFFRVKLMKKNDRQNDPYNFQRLFNLRLLLTFILLYFLSYFDQGSEFSFYVKCI